MERNQIKKVILYYNNDKEITSFSVKREKGSEEKVTSDQPEMVRRELEEIFKELKQTYGLSLDDLKDKGYIVLKRDNLLHNFKVNHLKVYKTAAIALAASVVLVGTGYAIGKVSKGIYPKTEDKTVSTTTEKPEIVWDFSQQNDSFTKTPEPTIEPTVEPIINEVVDVPYIDSYYQESVDLEEFGYEQDDAIVLRIGLDGVEEVYTQENFDCSLDSLSQVAYGSTNELIGNVFYPSQHSKPNSVMLMNYQYLFSDELEKAYVEYFAKIRNKIVEMLFFEDFDSSRELIKRSNLDVIEYVGYNVPLQMTLSNETTDIYYEDLSLDAKRTVLELSFEITTALYDETVVYDGVEYTQISLRDEDGLLTKRIKEYEELKNKTK